MMSNSNEHFQFTDERFADLQMLRYRLNGFEDLTLSQQIYIYCLAKATLNFLIAQIPADCGLPGFAFSLEKS